MRFTAKPIDKNARTTQDGTTYEDASQTAQPAVALTP